jgi:hypothetical protein
VLTIVCCAVAASTTPSLQLPQHREVTQTTAHLKQRLPLPIPAATDVVAPIESVDKPVRTLGGSISPGLQARLKVCFKEVVNLIVRSLQSELLLSLLTALSSSCHFFVDRLAFTSCSGTL